MILPIITALTREIFLQTPKLHEEAALALGATRWEMIRMAVLPFGRPGIITAVMLGLGRALGETMAVAHGALLRRPHRQPDPVRQPRPSPPNIALNFPEASGLKVNTLIATGLVLFVITLGVNMIARVDHQPAQRILGSQLMTATLTPVQQALGPHHGPAAQVGRPYAGPRPSPWSSAPRSWP